MMMEFSPTTIAPLLLRNALTSIFIYADKSFLRLAQKYKPLQFVHHLLISFFLFFLRLLPSFLTSFSSNVDAYAVKSPSKENYVPACGNGDSAIARALSQLLYTVTEIPVSSRKYEIVRSLAERLIDDNQRENVQALREVNCRVLSSAFTWTLGQLEATVVKQGRDEGGAGFSGSGPVQNRLNRVLRLVQSRGGWRGGELNRSVKPAEKLAAELLWLAQKLAACGFGEEVVGMWASASNLGRLALSAEPRLQGSLVKVSAFLFKEAKGIGLDETEEEKKEQQRQIKMKILLSWLPLLCRASNGVEVPVLSTNERAELEKILEETIEMLELEEEQERVLSLWLHHFTYTPSSDWPNLHDSYARWYSASRKLLLLRY